MMMSSAAIAHATMHLLYETNDAPQCTVDSRTLCLAARAHVEDRLTHAKSIFERYMIWVRKPRDLLTVHYRGQSG